MFEWIKRIPKFLELFKEGKELTNAATWKNRTVAANTLVAFLGTLLALGRAFNFSVPIDDATLANLAAGVVAMVTAVNAVMHTITSARVGLSSNGGNSPPAEQSDDAGKPSEG